MSPELLGEQNNSWGQKRCRGLGAEAVCAVGWAGVCPCDEMTPTPSLSPEGNGGGAASAVSDAPDFKGSGPLCHTYISFVRSHALALRK